jgi:hypothetical protein
MILDHRIPAARRSEADQVRVFEGDRQPRRI